MEALTSVDYANLIRYIAQQRYSQILNKTQVNKILFYVYGKYLAMLGEKLFTDDSPMAWPYGPVIHKGAHIIKDSPMRN